ncbi:MAG TPA: SDR family NAD(P)-dependent oxidoreductase [Amycolatopsis sp.]|nr:SDR family NAD(P)-dependent oxidoreductase [Amycolatopsis sp.]
MTVVLITGGANGIGAAVARRFAADDAHVVVAEVEEQAGTTLAEEIGGLFVRTDVSSEADNEAAVRAALSTYGGLDVVHLNAGTGGAGGLDDLDVDRYRRTPAVNVDGTVFGLRAAYPALRDTGGGAIVVTSSLAGISPAAFDPPCIRRRNTRSSASCVRSRPDGKKQGSRSTPSARASSRRA